jgi:hypothetical protein
MISDEAITEVMADWRYFDNGGKTADRYTCFQGMEGNQAMYLDMSDDPFHPQGVGMHGHGLHPDVLTAVRDDNPLGVELELHDLPEKVQRCVMQDARLDLELRTRAA